MPSAGPHAAAKHSFTPQVPSRLPPLSTDLPDAARSSTSRTPAKLQKDPRRASATPTTMYEKRDLPSPNPGPHPAMSHMRSFSALSTPISPPSALAIPNPAPLPWAPKTSQDSPTAEPKPKRKTWLPGLSSRKTSADDGPPPPRAWIAGHTERIPYDISLLARGNRMRELWDEEGDTLVYLFPADSGKGPSFRVRSAIYASSAVLVQRVYGMTGANQHGPTPAPGLTRSDDTLGGTPPQFSLHVRLQLGLDSSRLSQSDVEELVAIRNMFAFLVGQSLVATERYQSIFSIFMRIATSLKSFEFTNVDGSSFGEVAAASFDTYVDELRLADCRTSRSKTIEGIVLGESMRSVLLYNEAFTHAVGKYDDIREAAREQDAAQKFGLISPITVNRLERASIDLAHRQKGVNTRLSDFEFPSIFAGIMNSKTTTERKHVNFEAWKDVFASIRKHVLNYYKNKYGSWPPKASSKKNDLEISGLSRAVLNSLYRDFSDWYDLYVDRTSISTRLPPMSAVSDGPSQEEQPAARVLRRVFDEYDRSHPPVQPPVPYDVPIIPSLRMTRPDYGRDPKADSKARGKKLKEEETSRILDAATNPDVRQNLGQRSAFVASIRHFELKRAKGSTISELIDLRAGMWIFMYAVLQALPMLVVDAPGVRHHQGVEYFLCSPPIGGLPWATSVDGGAVRKNWYGIAGGSGIVSLPSDLIEHGVEGVYRRSHCWKVAKEWASEESGPNFEATAEPTLPDVRLSSEDRPIALAAPFQVDAGFSHVRKTSQGFLAPETYLPEFAPRSGPLPDQRPVTAGSRPGTPGGLTPSPKSARTASPGPSPGQIRGRDRHRSRENLFSLGLEALPMPAGAIPVRGAGASRSRSRDPSATGPRRVSGGPSLPASRNPSFSATTFDDILGGMETKKGKKKK